MTSPEPPRSATYGLPTDAAATLRRPAIDPSAARPAIEPSAARPATSDSPYDNNPTTLLPRQQQPLSPADTELVPWHRPGTAPLLVSPDTPHTFRKVVGRTLSKAWDDSLFGMSAEAAFWQTLSIVPLLLALLGSVGFVAGWFGPDTLATIQNRVIALMQTLFSPDVSSKLIEPTVDTILHRGQADVVSIGFVISLWAGSSAIASFVESITIAYGQHEVRHPVAERFFALGLYLCVLFVGVFALPLLAVGPSYLPEFFPESWQGNVERVVNIAYYPVMLVLLVVLVATLYKVAPKHRHPWKRGVPGAVLAAIVFLVASTGLRAYLGYVTTHGLTYGALAAPIAFLLFSYMVGIAVILGAQFNNATLEYYPPRRSKRERRKWQRWQDDAEGAAPTH